MIQDFRRQKGDVKTVDSGSLAAEHLQMTLKNSSTLKLNKFKNVRTTTVTDGDSLKALTYPSCLLDQEESIYHKWRAYLTHYSCHSFEAATSHQEVRRPVPQERHLRSKLAGSLRHRQVTSRSRGLGRSIKVHVEERAPTQEAARQNAQGAVGA